MIRVLSLLVIIYFGWIPSLYAHERPVSRVEVEPLHTEPIQANEITFEFQLFDNQTRSLVADADLAITHEKKVHIFVYDPALREFEHVHPEFNGKIWSAPLKFQVSGNYWLWAQGQLKDGTEFSHSIRLTVNLSAPPWPAPALTDRRSGSSGTSTATLSNQRLRRSQMAMLDLKFSRTDGSVPEITPYLGAFAHVVSVPQDGDSLIHVHPMGTSDPSSGMLHVTFPEAGFYRLWVQFVDAGELRIIPLAVEVF